MWLQFCNTFCRGSKRPLVFEPLRQTNFSFLFLLTSLNENNFKAFSPCPLKEDILKNLKVLKFQPYIRVSRKFRDEFSSLFLPVFEDFFNTDFWILVLNSKRSMCNFVFAFYFEVLVSWWFLVSIPGRIVMIAYQSLLYIDFRADFMT